MHQKMHASDRKRVKAVSPYDNGLPFLHFKSCPYRAWRALDGAVAPAHYPWRWLHTLAYRCSLPPLPKSGREARLRFVEPVSICFDTFPDYARYEIIPMIWDCWPDYVGKVEHWIREHHVRAAIVTSSQTAARLRDDCQGLEVMSITEGIDVSNYKKGKQLVQREIDLLEYGSIKRNFFRHYVDGIKHINRANSKGCLYSFADLVHTLSCAKVVVALPRCDTEPEVAQGVETLTQRYWEAMLSGCVLLGRAPNELTDLIGYNPVVELDRAHADSQVRHIVRHIDDYQSLADRNRETALRMAPWEPRIRKIMDWLESLGYQCKNENE